MKKLKTIGLVTLAGMALTALFGAGSASATTVEVGGVTKNESVTISGSLAPGSSAVFKTTSGSFVITCTGFQMHGSTEAPFTGTRVGGAASSWAYSGCNHSITNHSPGKILGEHIPGTTNGTFYSTGAQTTAYVTAFGTYVNCSTSNTHVGTATGTASGHATLHINAVVNCGFFLPTAILEATGVITGPTGLGGSA